MTDKNGTGVTVLSHDSEESTTSLATKAKASTKSVSHITA